MYWIEQLSHPKKIYKMKSKIRFDLNSQDQAVVTAEIVYTDDVRDKVARTFYERLGYESNLAYVEIHPDTEIHGIQDGKDVSIKGRRIEIKTFGGDPQSTMELSKNLCTPQLEMLLKNIPSELKRRKNEPHAEVK